MLEHKPHSHGLAPHDFHILKTEILIVVNLSIRYEHSEKYEDNTETVCFPALYSGVGRSQGKFFECKPHSQMSGNIFYEISLLTEGGYLMIYCTV
jgi:hypothetical protein